MGQKKGAMGDRRELLSRGQGNEFLNKLEAAGLTPALAQTVINSKENVLARNLVELLSCEPTVSKLKLAPIIGINRSAPFNPEKFFEKGWVIEEQDERALKLTVLDFAKVRLETTLKSDESSVNGEEKLRRLKEANLIRLDAKVLQILWENQPPHSRELEVEGSFL